MAITTRTITKYIFVISILLFISCSSNSASKTCIDNANNEYSPFEDNASLPRVFLGCTLGETGISDAKQILRKQGYDIIETLEDGCPALGYESKTSKIKMYGYEWSSFMFLFQDNKLIRVFFMDQNVPDDIITRIKERYGEFYLSEHRDEQSISFYVNDDSTSLRFQKDMIIHGYSELRFTDYLRNSILPSHQDSMNYPF